MVASTPAYVHLLSLHPSTSVGSFLSLVKASSSGGASFDPLYVAQPHHLIHRPRSISRDPLLFNRFDLLIILPAGRNSRDLNTHKQLAAFPATDSLRALVSAHLVVPASLPEHATSFLKAKPRHSFSAPVYQLPREWADDAARPPPAAVVPEEVVKQTDPACTLLTSALAEWLRDFGSLKQGQGSVSMLTLSALGPGNAEKFEAFKNEVAQRLGYPRGERATDFEVSGPHAFESSQDRVMAADTNGASSTERWDIAEIGRWPAIWNWAEMLSSQDYRALEEKHGISDGVIQDKCILCLTDVSGP